MYAYGSRLVWAENLHKTNYELHLEIKPVHFSAWVGRFTEKLHKQRGILVIKWAILEPILILYKTIQDFS